MMRSLRKVRLLYLDDYHENLLARCAKGAEDSAQPLKAQLWEWLGQLTICALVLDQIDTRGMSLELIERERARSKGIGHRIAKCIDKIEGNLFPKSKLDKTEAIQWLITQGLSLRNAQAAVQKCVRRGAPLNARDVVIAAEEERVKTQKSHRTLANEFRREDREFYQGREEALRVGGIGLRKRFESIEKEVAEIHRIVSNLEHSKL